MGHSFGAAALVNLAHYHPRLLSTLVLLDPVISPYSSTPGPFSRSPTASSIRRREVWPSRPEAREKFERSPFFAAWDPRVLDRWVDFGVRDAKPGEVRAMTGKDGTGSEVTLSTTKHQEVFTFHRPSHHAFDSTGENLIHKDLVPDSDPEVGRPDYPFYRPEPSLTLSRLPMLRPSVLYVLGETSNVANPEILSHRMRVTGQGRGGSGRVDSFSIEGRGHLVPMEVPGECARLAGRWIGDEVKRWREGEGRAFAAWRGKSADEKTKIGPDWHEFINREKPKI